MKINEIGRSSNDKAVLIRITLNNKPVKGLKHIFQITGLNKINKTNDLGSGAYEILTDEALRGHRLIIDHKGYYSEIHL